LNFHLAGVIPVAGPKLDFNMPWHDALTPIGQDYLAIERCVVECANAGCETIWIVCNDDMQPLIRYRIGEMVQDPVWVLRSHTINKREYQKPIQIHYVPISPKDVNKRDCLGWSVLHGASVADKICRGLSTNLGVNKFYVSWPYAFYGPTLVRKHRDLISSKKNFFLSHDNKTVRDGEYLAFTFGLDELDQLKNEVKEKSTGYWKDPTERKEKLSLQERFSYRNFKLEDIFDTLTLDNSNIEKIDNYWKIDSWERYCLYIAEYGPKVRRPSKFILNYKEWNGIGVDDE